MPFSYNLSVIVPTFNGKSNLKRLLESLESQKFKDFEVVIVIDGSVDKTIGLKKLQWGMDITWIEQENKGRAGARNEGAKNSNAELLLFIDDDMVMTTNSTEKHWTHHQEFTDTILVGNQIKRVVKSSSDFEHFKSYLEYKWFKKFPLKGKLPTNQAFITAANFSISRELFEKMSGFDERLFDQEDFDLALRASKEDIPIFIDKTIYGWHMDNVDIRSYIKRQLEYKIATKNVLVLKPQYIENYKNRIPKLTFWKVVVYWLFANRSFLKFTEAKLYRLFPRRFRYKFYELSIWGYINYFSNKINW